MKNKSKTTKFFLKIYLNMSVIALYTANGFDPETICLKMMRNDTRCKTKMVMQKYLLD